MHCYIYTATSIKGTGIKAYAIGRSIVCAFETKSFYDMAVLTKTPKPRKIQPCKQKRTGDFLCNTEQRSGSRHNSLEFTLASVQNH